MGQILIGGLLVRGINGTELGDYWDGVPMGRDWGTNGTGDYWDWGSMGLNWV